jgi:hypothetical protein
MNRTKDELEFKIASLKSELKLTKYELKTLKKIEKLKKEHKKNKNKENE